MRSAMRPAPTSARSRSPGRSCSKRCGRPGSNSRSASRLGLVRPESAAAAAAALDNGGVALAGGTELVPLLNDGIVEADTLVELGAVVPRGVDGERIGAGTTLAELEADQTVPEALREA